MKIIIVGLGQSGKELAKELIEMDHVVTVIDINKEKIEEFTNNYDVSGICGNGASRKVQIEAKIKTADILIALTPKDEVNLLSCFIAKKLGVKYTIARIDEEEYLEDEKYFMEDFKIDLVINPEYDTAKEITRLITYPSSLKTGVFANGKVDMAELTVKSGNLLENIKVSEIRNKFNTNIIVSSILRDGKLIIPRGNAKIKENDNICVIASSIDLYKFLKKLKMIEKPVKKVLIVGCGNIGKYLLKNLSQMNLEVKVIEFEKERCIELMQEFPEIEIIHGDGVDSDMLLEEGIKNYDCCISLTGQDDVNLVVTLFAWSCKVRKIITKIISLTYTRMLHGEEIDNTLSPHLITLSSVHRFIRGINLENQNNEAIKSFYRFAENKAEAIEFQVDKDFKYLGKEIKDMKIKSNVLIAIIIRNGKAIIPAGNSSFELNDRIILVSDTMEHLSKIEEICD